MDLRLSARLTSSFVTLVLALATSVSCHRSQAPSAGGAASSSASSPAAINAGPGRWGKMPIAKSDGCNKGRAADGERTLSVAGADRHFIVSLPKSYDGSVPYPLAFGFHGKTRTHVECRDVDCRGFQAMLGERAILVYMKSLNAGWRDEGIGFANNVPFFAATLAAMKSEYCVDESRVLVAGSSSGAFFANELACKFGGQLMATFPVGGGLATTEGCQRPIPAIVLHGIDDSHVTLNLGEATRDYYRKRNGCPEVTEPPVTDAHAAVRGERDAGKETYRCVDYRGCRAGLDVTWCEHGEGGYDNSTHAWPTFGGKILSDFLDRL